MKIGIAICSFFLLTLQDSNPLLQYQKGKRLIVLVTRDVNSVPYLNQLRVFDDQKKKMRQREVLLFTLANGRLVNHKRGKEYRVDESSVRKAYKLSEAYNGIMLIGKDTRIKMSEPFGILPERIFSSIDKMPMRRQEMRGRN